MPRRSTQELREYMYRIRRPGPHASPFAPNFIDLEKMARTIYGEARGEPLPGKIAVAYVILNRAKFRNTRPWKVCSDPAQFSCWQQTDLNYREMNKVALDDPVFAECVYATTLALSGQQRPDWLTPTVRHYHTVSLSPVPYWAREHTPIHTLGNHVFYDAIS